MTFTNGQELITLCKEKNLKIYEVMIQKEMELTGLSEAEIKNKLKISLDIMKQAVERGLTEDIKSVSGLIGGDAKKITERNDKTRSVCGSLMSKAISRSMAVLEVNAAMGRIVAAPTAGSSGIVPGTLLTIAEEFSLDDERLVEGLLTASGVGFIISRNATVAGAEGGCQAETGSAAAMAAAAIVEMMGGTPEAALHGAAACLKNVLGLVCDPIAGLVEAPCEKRNAIGAANALISAEMALAGVESIIPFDEVVDAMYRVGRTLPFELRESAIGGLAGTPTGQRIKKEILGE
ncbi:L-serine ammonia-lyase, iron-sulfur-dependent, subunit alpha [Alkaliphilus transvaalensis]|uniref:L-serine ammonia-lyase, iron-sulfur-dependent, subunit alpha n=1 Tax=Alkaliphilus transvaalensis TaxID=114628 RepID=UPI00047BD875|nr:L-serine ammonia-lyase, iron-sulfur-dependent, subunit alpha [Alkaliphilus transvaalensis]